MSPSSPDPAPDPAPGSTSGDAYEDYLRRFEELRLHHAGARKRLDRERHRELLEEHGRLLARIDPDDVQLDEWKRLEELRFLLVLPDDDPEP